MNPQVLTQIRDLSYLLAAVLFILALKAMASPRTARRGNAMAAGGMLLAVIFTLWASETVSYVWIIVGLLAGTAIGTIAAITVKMTAMPQMVAIFNGFGGLASALVVLAELLRPREAALEAAAGSDAMLQLMVTIAITSLIGWVTFTGSLVAFAKLQDLMPTRPIVYPFQKLANAAIVALIVLLGVLLVMYPEHRWLIAPLALLSAVLGVTFVLPIGGADMPVVISLLNSYSGLAAAAAGFVIGNVGLIISGALVGASGVVLTRLMCRAMNRSLANVLFGAFGQVSVTQAGAREQRTVQRYSADDAMMVLDNASRVVIVPGYGLAVAQAQHAVKELDDLLTARGIDVRYAVHPVAGRMPGHMNVLLAEADVPYSQLYEMERINPEFEHTDAVIVIGANDVINPAARTDKSSPIYGMPILDVDKARSVMIIKRSLNPGFAGIDNDLFYSDKTMMLFGDAKEMVTELIQAMKR